MTVGALRMTPAQYVGYLEQTADMIASQGSYITDLDAAIGDGDHWLNLNIGFQKIKEQADSLKCLPNFQELFTQLSRLIMSSMGGTSGALYGSMYLAAAKQCISLVNLDYNHLSDLLFCWSNTIMERGNTQPGEKTMLDAIFPAAQKYKDARACGLPEREALSELKQAALDGAQSTKGMAAKRGRASIQPGKGVGHLDPGAVTMALQLECLADCFEA